MSHDLWPTCAASFLSVRQNKNPRPFGAAGAVEELNFTAASAVADYDLWFQNAAHFHQRAGKLAIGHGPVNRQIGSLFAQIARQCVNFGILRQFSSR
jgi:hypothetical protein